MDTKAQIKARLPMSQVAGQYTQLKKQGSRLVGCCPLHEEKTPSFHVNDQKGFFHCFGCGESGDIFSLVQHKECLNFPGAVVHLADIAGVELPRQGGRPQGDMKTLYAIQERAVTFYQEKLGRDTRARQYLAERGLSENTIRLFRIGVSPSCEWDALFQHLKGEFDERVLLQSGLFKKGRRGPYDLFHDRIMVPIRNSTGRTVGFGGRLLDGNGPKYINSPETPIFKKKSLLFNLDFAKAYIRRKREAVVVKGYIDFIQAYQAGVGGVVAPLGTAFSPGQATLLRRHVDAVTLNFDGDQAGQKAVTAALPHLLAADLPTRVADTDGDPDTFIRKQGGDAYRAALAEAADFCDHCLSQFDLNDPHERRRLVEALTKPLRAISDPVLSEYYLGRGAEAVAVPADRLRARLTSLDQKVTTTPTKKLPPRQAGKPLQLTPLEQAFLRGLLHNEALSRHVPLIEGMANHVFADREGLSAFILAVGNPAFEARLALVPESYRPRLRSIMLAPSDPRPLEELCQAWNSLMAEHCQHRRDWYGPPSEKAPKTKRSPKKRSNFNWPHNNLRTHCDRCPLSFLIC